MGICRSPRTLASVKRGLLAEFPNAQPAEGASDDVSHTLWIIEQVGLMAEQGKIDRWTGWVCAKTHSLEVIDRHDEALGCLRSLCRTDLGDRE